MTIYKCRKLLTTTGWKDNVFITTTKDGLIETISGKTDAAHELLDGYVMPGFQNGHSHSFQYAMGGLAEFMPANAKFDDFWTWREAMYNLALKISPDQLEAVTTMLYAEMLRNGTTHVVEFHYLHNDPNGQRYQDSAELAGRIVRAAETTGIELTMVPVYYQLGGFGKQAEPKQKRFLSKTVDSYQNLLAATKKHCNSYVDTKLGMGVHSLRAATGGDLKELLAPKMPGPFHLHIAEQQKEIDDCHAHYKKRPVEWVLGEFAVDQNFCFTHATHMNSTETKTLAQSGANVIICPSTEGNLGDGFFNLQEFRQNNGHYTIGSDSHIGLNPFEEIRWLDYVQRLRQQQRNVICDQPLQDSAATLIQEIWTGGRRTAGDFSTEYFSPGSAFDCLMIDPKHPALVGKPPERLLGAITYCGDVTAIAKVLRRGKVVVEQGRHLRSEQIVTEYSKNMAALNQ